jgi:hypothetical protein
VWAAILAIRLRIEEINHIIKQMVVVGFFVIVFVFETGSHYVAQAGLDFAILLLPPKYWDNMSASPHLA